MAAAVIDAATTKAQLMMLLDALDGTSFSAETQDDLRARIVRRLRAL